MNRNPSMLSLVALLLLGGVGHASMGDVLRNNRVEAGFAALNSILSTGEELEAGSGEEEKATETDPTLFGSPYETAHFYYQHGEYEDAIEQFLIYLQEPEPEADREKLSLVRLAESFYRQGALTQSVSILDLYLKQHPDDGMRAEILFQSGLIYREMGLFEEAISQFYRVLNSIVVTAESDLPRYLSLARRSQFEIAIGHFDKAEYGQALALLERLNPSELNPLDRETLHYYRVRATVGAGAFREGLTLVATFVESYPKSRLLPEMLYEQAELLSRLGRRKESLKVLMRLLEAGGAPEENSTEGWLHWRQRAGNHFANQYYELGDYESALRIYQGLVVLNEELEWRLPIIYQIALCFEHMKRYGRAEESLQFILQSLASLQVDEESPSLDLLKQLENNARWRLEMLRWREALESSLPESGQTASLGPLSTTSTS